MELLLLLDQPHHLLGRVAEVLGRLREVEEAAEVGSVLLGLIDLMVPEPVEMRDEVGRSLGTSTRGLEWVVVPWDSPDGPQLGAATATGANFGFSTRVTVPGMLAVSEPAATMEEIIANGKAAVADGKAEFPFLVQMDPKQGDPYHLYPLQTSMGVPVFGTDETGSYDASKLELGNPGGVRFA